MGNSLSSDDFKCIGGENWYKERCSKNFLVSVTMKLFADSPVIPDVFRENESIRFSRSQNIRLSESLRKIYLDNIHNYVLKSSAGVLQAEDTLGLETVHLQELSVIVNTTSSFEEFFIRRNALVIFMHRILRSAQINNASLRPSLPGASTFCTCNRNPHLEYCPLHDILDEEKKFLFLPLSTNMRVQRGPDWQWADQDGGIGHQGTVLMVKEWKLTPHASVRVKWDENGTENTYRYGGENCYDVVLANPLSHKDYRAMQGVEYPSCTSWSGYCNTYLSNGIAKSRGLWHSKIAKQKLQLMLPNFDIDGRLDKDFVGQSIGVIKEVMDLAMQDSLDYLDEKRPVSKPFERSNISQIARMEVLFPFQIYLFSQVQGDLLNERTESCILVQYLQLIYTNVTNLIERATRCYCQRNLTADDILKCLENSILQELVPFIMTCLYCGSLNDDIMINADYQISEMVKLWTNFLNIAHLNIDRIDNEDNSIQTALLSKAYSTIPSTGTTWYFALLYILVSADSRYITGLAPALVPLDSNDELLMVWARSYILSGGLSQDVHSIVDYDFLYPLYTGKDPMWKTIYSWMDIHFREAMWKSKLYRNTQLEFRLFIVLIHLSNTYKLLQTIYNRLLDSDPSVVPVPDDLEMIWKSVINVREHLRTKKQEFQITKDLKGLQRSTSFTLNRRSHHHSSSNHTSESESDSEEIKLDNSSYKNIERVSTLSSSSIASVNTAASYSDSENHIHVVRSQSDTFGEIAKEVQLQTHFEPTQSIEAEYSEFDPELAESFKNLREIEKNYSDKLDLLMNMNQPIDVTTHKHAYQYSSYNSDKPFTRKTINNIAPPELEDDLPSSITETVVQSVHSFLINTPSLSGEDIENHLNKCIISAKERAQAFNDSVEILEQLRMFPQASRLYLLGVQSALISTPNAATYRSRLSQFSPFTNSLDEIQMADFMANIHGVGSEYISLINQSILRFCEYLMRLCEQCVKQMRWRLGTTVLWILSSDFNNNLIYDPFYLGLPGFLQRMLKQLSSRIGQDVLISAGPFWDKNCKRIPSNEVVNRGKNGNPFVNNNGDNNELSIFCNSACSTPLPESDSKSVPQPTPITRPSISVSSALNSIRNSVRPQNRSSITTITRGTSPASITRGNPSSSTSSPSLSRSSSSDRKPTDEGDPSYGCFSTAVFALANSLRICYGLIIIRQFYNHQLKLKETRPQHMNTRNWSLDDVFMVFGYENEPYYQCTRGMFNEFMEYFTFLLDCFERKCHKWKPSGINADTVSKGIRHGCFRSCECNTNINTNAGIESEVTLTNQNELICPERNDLLISSGESVLSYYLSLISWVLTTYIGGMIDWPIYGDTIWRFTYASPRLRKLAIICLQSIVPYTDYLPSMLNDKSLYSFMFSKKEVEKLPSELSTVLSRHRRDSNILLSDDEEEDDDEEEEMKNSVIGLASSSSDQILIRDVDPQQMSIEEKEQAFVYYLLHLCVHDDFCFGAMTEERLACAQCCPFFPYIYQRLSTEIVEEEDDNGHSVNKRRFMFYNPPSLQPKSLKTRCKMLIRPEGYGASNCNLVVAEEVVYLLRAMLQSERWKTLILDIFEVILERAADQIEIEKQNIQNIRTQKRSENKERERIVWYSMGSAVLKVMGSISRRLYAGCRVRVRQQFMDHISDTDVLIQTIHQSSGTGYVIDYNINSSEVLVLLDQIQMPKIFGLYTLDVVDKILPPDDLSDETRDFLITHVQRVIINLEYPDELFELPGDDKDSKDQPLNVVELQNLVLEQNAIFVLHQLIISFPESVKLLSKEFVTVLFSLALKPSPAKGIFGTEFIRFCFNHLAELLIDTYPGCPHLFPSTTVLSPRPQAGPIDPLVYGQDKDESHSLIEIYQSYDPNRLKTAQKLQEIVDKPIPLIYNYLKIFHDDKTVVVNHLLETDVTVDMNVDSICEHVNIDMSNGNAAAIDDLDCPRSSPLFSGQSVRNIIAKKAQVMHSVPYFAQFEPATPNNIQGSLNTIASKRTNQMDVVYPTDPTGVVVGVQDYNVILSLLDINSGISRQELYSYNDIVFHKRRFGNSFTSMASLRRMTARICLNLDLRLLRELIITLLYTFDKQNINIISTYDVKPSAILTFTKLIHVFYATIANKSYISGMTHMTPASALTYILKQTLIHMIEKETNSLLFNEFIKDCWTFSPFGSIILPLNDKKYYVSSPNPYYMTCKYHDKVVISKAQALRVIFDNRCNLQENQAFLTFYRDSSYSHVIARFTGSFNHFSTFHVQGNTLYYSFESNQLYNDCWGYGFVVEPLIGLSWNNDQQVFSKGCFDWICWQLEMILDLGEEYSLINNSSYFNTVVHTIISYICTYGAPYKSRAIELLLRLLSQPQLYPITDLPDITGIKLQVYRRMKMVSSNKVPPEIRLMLEMCMSFELYNELIQLKTPTDSINLLPPFNPHPEDISFVDDRLALRDVHRLARNLYYSSLPDACYLHYVVEHCDEEWTEESYQEVASTMMRFTRQQDISLTSIFHQRCLSSKTSPKDFDIHSFFLTQEDLIRFNNLQDFTGAELRQRLTLIRLLNRQLSQVIQFIDLMDIAQDNRLGTILCAMSEYIDPSTKESVLELSIKETAYDPKDSRPVIILDSMRTYEDPEDSGQRAPILFNESITKNAFTSQCTFAQMFREVMKIDTNILRSPLDKRDRLFAVKYKGEQGLDFGGLYRDTIERCVEDLFSDRIDLFLPCPNSRDEEGINEEKYLPNPKYRHSLEVMDMYIFVGYLIGISLRTKQQLAFELPSMIWTYFIGSQPTIEDLESVDTDFVTLLKSIKEFDEEEAEESFYDTFGLTFSITDLANNENELIPGGIDIPVTYETAEKWCDLALDFKLNEFKQAAEAISCGIQALVPQRSIALFTWDQLERAVCGEPEIDIEDLKQHTIYANWTEQHPVVKRFWKVMEGLDNKDRSQFLRFTWGRSRLPHKDSWPRPFKLCARNYGDDMLPLAHTCFFELELPLYSSEQIMRERLLIAIHYGASEFMLR